MQWFRFYNEVLNDPKVQGLSGDDFKGWVNILCVASQCNNNGTLPKLSDLSFMLRMSENDAKTLLERLCERSLIDRVNGGANGYAYACHAWNKRQYKSDSSTDRVKRYRNAARNNDVTPPDTDTETDTEQIKYKEQRDSKFDEFWKLYPRKKEKVRAKKWWDKNAKSEEKQDEIINGLKKHLPSMKANDKRYIAHPTTWLNGERWNDEVEEITQTEKTQTGYGNAVYQDYECI